MFKKLTISFLTLVSLKTHGFAPEALESKFILGTTDYFIDLGIDRTDNQWRSLYHDFSFHVGWFKESAIWSFGFQKSEELESSSSESFYVRYDWLVGQSSSISFKFLHDNWYWLNTGRESLGIEYNILEQSSYYLTLGYYHRWTKQTWDDDPYNPLHFNNEDSEGFFTLIYGFLFDSEYGTYSIDINNRDDFNYYTSDFWALDSKLYLNSSAEGTLYFKASIRFTGLMGLTLYPGSFLIGMGYSF
ncbi:MAG: hypothetical protein AB8E15_00445 [Bdellovibrionales bacterium]